MVDLDTISFRLLKTLEEKGLSVGEAESVLKKAQKILKVSFRLLKALEENGLSVEETEAALKKTQKILKESVSNMELNIEEKEHCNV